jgi:hypothetical protein
MVRSEGAVTTAAVATAATADGAVVSETAHAEAVQEDGEDDGEDSFNYNSESSEDDKFPTAVMLQLPEVHLQGERASERSEVVGRRSQFLLKIPS